MIKSTQQLPDAMPDVGKRTLLVVCDGHQCKLIDVGNHTLLLADSVESREPEFTDKQGRYQSPAAVGKGGIIGGTGDLNPVEKHRMKEFANTVSAQIAKHVRDQKIEELHVSAPAKFLSELKTHLSAPVKKMVVSMLEGNYLKEAPRDILLRFKPELEAELQKLRDQENYSPKNKPPKKSK